MKIYISGKITGLNKLDYLVPFQNAQRNLEKMGHKVMNPASSLDECTEGFEQNDYLHVCYAMIDVCDAIYMLGNWQSSQGARKELQYASDWKKQIIYQDVKTQEPNFPVVHG